MKYFFHLAFFFFFGEMAAQHLATSRTLGMAGLTTVFDGPDALFNNPAGLAGLEHIALAAGTERRFWWANIGLSGMGAALPTGSGTFGLTVQSYGITDFRQQKMALSYSRFLAGPVRIGGQLDYYRTAIPDYGSTGTLSFEIGLQAILSKNLTMGAHVAHPHQVEISDGDRLPTLFQLGLLYRPTKKANVGLEIEKDIEFPLRLKMGVEYMPVEKMAIRTGVSSDPANFHLGFGFRPNERWQLDLANRYDPTLGMTSSLSVGYVFLKK